jgi:tetratricopeptide (TPR) repeat protein
MSDDEIYSLALLYKANGEDDKALATFKAFFGRGDERSLASGTRLVQMSMVERKYADAESLAVILRDAYPNNAGIVSLLGSVKYLSGDTTTAVRHFFEALALDTLNEEALRTLAHIHIIREEYPEAVSFYRRLTAQKGVGEPYRRGIAVLLYHIKEYDEAGARLDTLIQENNTQDLPGLHELHVYRGLVYSQTKAYDKAAEEFKKAIAYDSLYEDAWKELCYMYIIAKDKENARINADGYVTALPRSGTAWRLSGYAFEMQKKYDDAAIAFERAVQIDSTDYYAWFRLGSSLERQKLIDDAANAFRKVLQLRPGYADAANYLGYMWADAGIMLDSAKVLIEIALEKEPKNGAYIDSYAWVFYRLGDYEKALHYMNEAMVYIKDDPDMKDDPVPYEHIGDIQFKLKNYHEAEAAYKRSIELKTEDAERINKRLTEIRDILRKGGGR